MLEEKIAASAPAIALRDEDGALRGDFVDWVAQRVAAGDAAALRTLLGDLHESDVGDLIQALDAEMRPRLVSLMGPGFDFLALTEVDNAVRAGILEELPAETVAAGVRNSIRTMPWRFLRICPRRSRPKFLSSFRPPSAWR